MARIRPLDPGEVDPQTAQLFAPYLREQSSVPNMLRTLAYRPELAQTFWAHLRAVLTTGTVETRLKEMLAVRVSQVNDCMY